MYFFYLDESGTQSISANSIERSPFFTLAALALHESNWRAVDGYLTEVKKKYFPAVDYRDIELKSRVIKSALAKAGTTSSPWPSLGRDDVLGLIDDLYRVFEQIPFTMMFIAIDKEKLCAKYANPYPPYAVAFSLIRQEAARFLRKVPSSEQGIFVVDQHQEAEKRLPRYEHIARSLDSTSPSPAGLDIVIERPFFVDSKQYQVIQLADLCAYNVSRAVTFDDYDYDYFKRIEPYIARPTTLDSRHGVLVYPARFTWRDHDFGL